jgi:hypothetical protein
MSSTAKTPPLQFGDNTWAFFWIASEVLLLIAFITGFYAVAHLNDEEGFQEQVLAGDTSDDVIKGAVKSMAITTREARICGYVAMTCTALSFVMVTIISRVSRIPTP